MTVGVLGDATRAREISILEEWADVKWGVDSLADAFRHLSTEKVDILVVDASVAYLTAELRAQVLDTIGVLCAVAETDGVFEWASRLDGVACVRGYPEVRQLMSSVEPREVGTADATSVPSIPVASASPARVIAVWGPVGAPGVTTTAISLATVCAQAGRRTILCDLDSRGSSIAIALGITDDTPGFAAACRLAGRAELTPGEIDRVAQQVDNGTNPFRVLTGLPRASRWAEVDPVKARTVITQLRDLFDVVIVDVGSGIEHNDWVDDAPQRDGVSRDVIRHADSVIAVGTADAVGIARLIRGLDDLHDLCSDPVVILNRVAPGDGGDATDAIRRFSDHSVRAVIPADSRGGVESASARARAHGNPWREIVSEAGIDVPRGKTRGWRR
jgi:MinD-like ATPase involved in chromosome partitioning or flagellar assembly